MSFPFTLTICLFTFYVKSVMFPRKKIKDFFFLSSFYKNMYLHSFVKWIVYVPKNLTFWRNYESIEASKRHQNVGLNVGLKKKRESIAGLRYSLGLKEAVNIKTMLYAI